AIIEGQVRSLQDLGVADAAARVHHARPLILVVEKIRGVKTVKKLSPILISPVALFVNKDLDLNSYSQYAQYTFVQSAAGDDALLDEAGAWIARYAEKHSGRVITNFDEQRPMLAGAPLSYQNLVSKAYDKAIVKHLAPYIQI